MTHMDENKVESAQIAIDTAVMLRLLFIAWLAVMCARGYASEESNVFRMYRGGSTLMLFTPCLFADTALTILWRQHPLSVLRRVLYTMHLVFYIVFGGFFYLTFFMDIWNVYGIGAIGLFFLIPLIWLLGLIPFIVYGRGRKKLKQALTAPDQPTEGALQ